MLDFASWRNRAARGAHHRGSCTSSPDPPTRPAAPARLKSVVSWLGALVLRPQATALTRPSRSVQPIPLNFVNATEPRLTSFRTETTWTDRRSATSAHVSQRRGGCIGVLFGEDLGGRRIPGRRRFDFFSAAYFSVRIFERPNQRNRN